MSVAPDPVTARPNPLEIKRIELPGVDQEQAAVVSEIVAEADLHQRHLDKEKGGMILAMLRLRKPVSFGGKRRGHAPVKHEGNVFERMASRQAASAQRRAVRAAKA